MTDIIDKDELPQVINKDELVARPHAGSKDTATATWTSRSSL